MWWMIIGKWKSDINDKKILKYSQSMEKLYFFLSHSWWGPLIKFIVKSIMNLRWKSIILRTLAIPKNYS